MKKIYVTLCIIHAFVGIGAVFGGLYGLTDPSDLPTDMLKYGPFKDFVIPSLFLLGIIGLGNLLAAILIIYRWHYIAYYSGVMGGILISWIVIQCLILFSINSLHIIFFVIGCIIGILAMMLAFMKQLPPTTWLKQYFKKH